MYDQRHFEDSAHDRWEAEIRAAAAIAAPAPPSPPCPECNSKATAPAATAKTWLGIAGATAGAAGGAAEAIFRSTGSLRLGGLPVTTIAMATLAGLAGATSGFTLGVAIGQRLDILLGRHRCGACGHRYRVPSPPAATRELAPA